MPPASASRREAVPPGLARNWPPRGKGSPASYGCACVATMVAGAEGRIIGPMAGLRYLHSGFVAGAATLAVQYLHAAVTVDVNPQTFEGRTSAAIAEFRAAVALDADLAHGRELFAACAECHRADGSGSADGTIPVIAGQHVSVLVKQLVDFRHDRAGTRRCRTPRPGTSSRARRTCSTSRLTRRV